MRYIVFVYDPDECQTYLPLIEAPTEELATSAAEVVYDDCYIGEVFDTEYLQHLLKVVTGGDSPDLKVHADGTIVTADGEIRHVRERYEEESTTSIKMEGMN